MSILEQMEKIQNRFESIKPDFEKFIKNKEISLEDRWAVFVKAPTEMKTDCSYTPDFNNLPSDFIMYEGPVHMDRGETKTGIELVAEIEESLQDIKDDMYCGSSLNQKELEKVVLDNLKEEILEMNLGKFSYDW